MNFNIKNQGFTIVELVIALAIFAILAAGVFYVATNSYRNFYGTGDTQTVTEFAQEGLEIVRAIRDNSWQSIESVSGSGAQGVVKNVNGYWEFSGSDNTSGDLTRTITISNAQRDSNWDIVDSGGTEDINTKKLVITVSGTGISDYVLTTYMTNWSYKTWEQSDWSGVGDREFWSDMTMASSAYSNINTTTAGQVVLSQSASGVAMSWALSELNYDDKSEYKAWEDFYNFYIGPDGKSLYVTGTTNYDFVKYNIAGMAGNGPMRPEWKIAVPWHMHTSVIHPNQNYAYLGKRNPADGTGMICVADLTTLTIDSLNDCYDITYPGSGEQVMDMVVNAAGDRLYVFDIYGYGYTFTISDAGATLAILNSGEVLTPAAGNSINQVYFDESGATDYFYLVTDHNSGEFIKVKIDQTTGDFDLAGGDSYTDGTFGYDLTDIEFLETSSGNNRFVVVAEDSSKEFLILEDTGTSVSEVGYYNLSPSSQNYPSVVTDGENLAWVQFRDPNEIFAIDITNRASPADGSLSTTLTRKYSQTTYDQFEYSTTTHGLFVNTHDAVTNTTTLYYIGQDLTRATGGNYNYKRAVTVGLSSTVSGGPHDNFPVVISETQDYLKTVANGGKVYSDDGYDIIFTYDSNGDTVLDHEIEYYDGSTGEFVAWVKIPTLSADTTIYMFYGNSDISTSQENIKGVWSQDYQMVSHMVDAGTGGVGDSVMGSGGWFKSGPNTPLQSTSLIGRGQYFDGTASGGYLTIENNGDKQQKTSDFTVEVWVNKSSSATETVEGILWFGNGNVSNQDGWLFRHYQSTSKVYFHMGDDATTNLGGMYLSNSAITDDAWNYLAVTADRDVGYQAYINKTAGNSYAIDSSAYSIGDVYDIYIGRDYHATLYYLMGTVDEFRVSTVVRSTDWMDTGYNNITSTSTFYSIGSESSVGGYDTPGSLYSSILDLGSSDKEIKSITVEQDIPSGCSLQVTAEVSDDITFASGNVTSEIYSDSSTGYYTSSTDATINGKRYLRYKVDMTACNSNTESPTLYGAKFNYR